METIQTFATTRESPETWRTLPGRLAGYFWSIAPNFLPSSAPGDAFFANVDDAVMGRVRLEGLLHHVASSRTLVVILHGDSGSPHSRYCALAARAAHAVGFSTLRLPVRGEGTDDLRLVLETPGLERYDDIFLVGYAIGGCVSLRAAIDHVDFRIRGVVAICAPLNGEVAKDVHRIETPSLLVLSENDPVVPAWSLHDVLFRASGALTSAEVKAGGHLYFPASLDLGQDGPLGLEPQMLRWLADNT